MATLPYPWVKCPCGDNGQVLITFARKQLDKNSDLFVKQITVFFMRKPYICGLINEHINHRNK